MKETCANSEGTGNIKGGRCGGSGRRPAVSLLDETCHECPGTGEIHCPECHGTGALAAEIPAAYSGFQMNEETCWLNRTLQPA